MNLHSAERALFIQQTVLCLVVSKGKVFQLDDAYVVAILTALEDAERDVGGYNGHQSLDDHEDGEAALEGGRIGLCIYLVRISTRQIANVH